MPLSSPVPLTVGTLEKLSPAVDPTTSVLAATLAPTSDSENPSLWALLLFGGSPRRFGWPAVHTEFSLGRPDTLSVRAEGAGSLLISRGDIVLGSLAGGVLTRATPTPLVVRALGGYVMAAIKGNEGNTGASYWNVFHEATEYVLRQLSARTHGASLILLPRGSHESARSFFKPRFSLSRDIQAHAVLRSLHTTEEGTASHLDELLALTYGAQLGERLDAMAQLAAVDGALVVSTLFDVLGFGVTLGAPLWTGRVVTGPDGFGDGGAATFDLARLGTRHSSAVNFVGAIPGAVAFVVSQDALSEPS